MPTHQSRREYLRTTVGAVTSVGIGSTAGCLGILSSDEGGEEIHVGHAGEGTISGNAALAIQRIVREHSDEIDFGPEGTGGDPTTIRLIDDGDLNGAVMHTYAYQLADESRPPFEEDPIDSEVLPYQCLSTSTFQIYWLGVEGSGLETTDDLLESDAEIWLLDPEWANHQLARELLAETDINGESALDIIEDRIVFTDADDAAGAIEEGRIDGLLAQSASYRGLPSYTQEKDARADVYALEVTEQFAEPIEEAPAVELEETDVFGWEQDLGTDTLTTITMPDLVWLTGDVSNDAVYELMEVVYEHQDEFAEAAPTNLEYSDQENMAIMGENAPVHPGAAEYFEDNGIWDDDLTVADNSE